MKEEIKNNLDNPAQLEKLYRDNKTTFKRAFGFIYPDVRENITAQIWNERLFFYNEEISWGTTTELIFVIIAALFAGLIAKIPDFTSLNPEYFYPRNIAFIIFPMLTAYFAWKQKMKTKKLIPVITAILVSALYINILPNNPNSNTLILACIHLPIFMWALLGFTFAGVQTNSVNRRLDFLRYNGDLVVMTTLILFAGGLLSGITFGLFELIDIKIEKFYFQYIAIWGLAAAPIVGTYLIQTNPQLVNKISPVIAKIFTPLVSLMLLIYLGAVIMTGKNPYNDREFLLIINLLLIGVMAIILFSVTETLKNEGSKVATALLFTLSVITSIINGIALSAIIFRISSWGITPNRLAVLGSNALIFINLVLVSFRLFKTVKNKDEIENVEKNIATFLPMFVLWAVVVAFVFPLLFGFR